MPEAPTPWAFDLAGFARAIAAKRDVDGLTLREVAARTGASLATVNRIEHGKMPEICNAIRLCQWLGVTLDAFVVRQRK